MILYYDIILYYDTMKIKYYYRKYKIDTDLNVNHQLI